MNSNQENLQSSVIIRPISERDINFIFSTMLRGLHYGSDFFKAMDSKVFYPQYQKLLEQALPNLEVRIASLRDDDDVILAYLLLKQDSIVFAYTKKEFRGMGLQRMLLGETPIHSVSHITKSGDAIRRKMNLEFNPF